VRAGLRAYACVCEGDWATAFERTWRGWGWELVGVCFSVGGKLLHLLPSPMQVVVVVPAHALGAAVQARKCAGTMVLQRTPTAIETVAST